jgi:methylmalonyl-CoA mutase C-terminal domain/subunit
MKKEKENKDRKIKVLITKVGLDGHDRGAKVVASLLKEAGMEVIYLGMYLMPKDVVDAAIDEDVDVIGLSLLSGGHLVFTPLVLDDVLLIVGGIIPSEDIPTLKAMGVHAVFPAGSLTEPIVTYIRNHVRP